MQSTIWTGIQLFGISGQFDKFLQEADIEDLIHEMDSEKENQCAYLNQPTARACSVRKSSG
jgi:hypothetical protein